MIRIFGLIMFNRINRQLCGNKKCCVVIPTHKNSLSELEERSLKRCFEVWEGNHDIFLALPETSTLELPSPTCNEVRCDDRFFSTYKGYNSLCVNADFYETFSDYEYLLIYQTDCFVFYDALDYFCSLGYDYIGAPWPANTVAIEPSVGNGGFSLRKVKSFIDTFKGKEEEFSTFFDNRNGDRYEHNEDTFISIRHKDALSIPNADVAATFSLEWLPGAFISRTNKIPMGCHAWPSNYSFWQNVIKQ